MTPLLDPITVGSITAPNRIWMSPMTRARATEQHVPTPVMAEYYVQRAATGIIISEGVGISQQGLGWPWAPGLWTEEQIEAWKPITKAVHDKGGRIFAQLWHMGRAVHSSVTHQPPVSASATSVPGKLHTYEGKKASEIAHALTVSEIKEIVNDYGRAARNAMRAGFDGVELHGANGYLIDQFLRNAANFRSDEYGGSIQNRTRFLEEVVSEVANAIGSDKTALRLSPNGEIQGIDDNDPVPLFTAVALMLNKYNLAFVELREAGKYDTFFTTDAPKLHGLFRQYLKAPLVLNQEYSRESAEEALSSGIADAIAFGRPFIANPDLVEKIKRKDDDWIKPSIKTWYSRGLVGYTDYPIKYPTGHL